MKSPVIIKRDQMTYVIYSNRVVVGVGEHQWIGYDKYSNWNQSGITEFRQKLLKSRDDQYRTPSDQITLAMQCNIIGVGTLKPGELK